MAKLKTVYLCQDCGHKAAKWAGQCPGCAAWNTLVEEVEAVAQAVKGRAARAFTELSSELTPLGSADAAAEERIPTGIGELDRLLGGGFVGDQVALLAGPPGIGKSTLMLHVAERLARGGRTLVYATGEESLAQVSARAKRLGVNGEGILLLAENSVLKILEAVKKADPGVLVIDSIQTVYHPELSGSPGSVGQVRECAAELLRLAKSRGILLLLLGHVTKEGSLAGPKVLEHMVDTVVQFEAEKQHLLRMLRVQKNRFGPTSEIGLFEMTGEGLREVSRAGDFFLMSESKKDLAGRAYGAALEGTRPILAEVQALAAYTRYPLPRRTATGFDSKRLDVLLAAMERHLGLRLENRDVFTTLAGGIRLRDPGLDLSVCAAVHSSVRDAAIPHDWVFIGEVGLLGEIGRVTNLAARLGEAERAGFTKAFVPKGHKGLPKFKTLSLVPVEGLAETMAKLPEGTAARVD